MKITHINGEPVAEVEEGDGMGQVFLTLVPDDAVQHRIHLSWSPSKKKWQVASIEGPLVISPRASNDLILEVEARG